jgi:TIR domain
VTDVFLSYASEDRERAATLARSLEAAGWTVWWDRKILAGHAFDQAIERELETARSVVVLWSGSSIASEWVKNEAAAAAERGVLVPALIERVKIPLEFRRKQTADLVDWTGDATHEGFQGLCAGIADRVGRSPAPSPRPAPAPGASRQPRRGLSLAGIVAAIVLGLGATWFLSRPAPAPVSGSTSGHVDPADLASGVYYGGVISDAKGSSRSDVTVTVTKVGPRRVRITSDYERLGTVEVELTRVGDGIQSAGGDTTFLLEPRKEPPTLSYNPHGDVAYSGRKE